jgi:hypothetical protein
MDTVTAEPGIPAFFRIPGELRNRIYREVLVPEPYIYLSQDDYGPQPPLLRTCTQIRTEAMGIYYLENNFRAYIFEFDLRKLLQHAHRYFQDMNLFFRLGDQPHWSNLLQ